MDKEVTVVVTSCRRHDLLARTLESFFATNDYPLREVILIEDSDDRAIFEFVERFSDQPIRIIFNERNIGQIASVDKAYREVKTPYILHLEDDWEFTRRGVLREAMSILDDEPSVLIVMLRDEADMPRYVRSLKTRKIDGVSYKRMFPELHFIWHTFTFNPTLKRTSDYMALPDGYGGIGAEGELSRWYKREGWCAAWLMGDGARHIGAEASHYARPRGGGLGVVTGPLGRFFSVQNLVKWRESFRRRFWHRLRLMGMDTEPLQRGRRGTRSDGSK